MRLLPQLDQLDQQIAALSIRGELASDAQALREDYERLCAYALDGLPDPDRENMVADLQCRLLELSDRLDRLSKTPAAATLYFSTLRYRQHGAPDMEQVVNAYLQAIDQLNLVQISGAERAVKLELLRKSEEMEKQAFNAVWTTFPLSPSQKELLASTFSSTEVPDHFKQLLAMALVMGLLQYFDERRLELLITIYENPDSSQPMQVKAMCGLLIALWFHRHRVLSTKTRQHLEQLDENPQWVSDVPMALMQFIRTRDTERAVKKMQTDVLPEMDRFGREMSQKKDELLNPENPDWQEMLENSGIGARLREMQEMQEDGVDVMLTMFQRLKGMAFFNEISNWFLPFHTSHSSVMDMQQEPGFSMLGQILRRIKMFCDTDRYASLQALNLMPTDARKNFLSQLDAQGIADHADDNQPDSARASREQLANQTVRDLNRFFTQFRRCDEFANPFTQSLDICHLKDVVKVLDSRPTLRLLAEFYMQRGYYREASTMFGMIKSFTDEDSAEVIEKLGYCFEAMGNMAQALNEYKMAAMMHQPSRWLNKRLANAYRANKFPEEALKIYGELAQAKPDGDPSLELCMGHCCLSMRQYNKALDHYYKAEFLLGDDTRKTMRPIAWASTLAGDLDQAKKYYDQILADEDHVTATDLLNAAHLHTVSGNYRQALLLYRCARAKDPSIMQVFDQDRPTLEAAGVDSAMLDIILDNL